MTKSEPKPAIATVKDRLLSEPDGLREVVRAVMQTAAMKPGTPLLWVIGKRTSCSSAYAFALAPQNAKSAYLVIDAGHVDAPMKASSQIIDWLNALWQSELGSAQGSSGEATGDDPLAIDDGSRYH